MSIGYSKFPASPRLSGRNAGLSHLGTRAQALHHAQDGGQVFPRVDGQTAGSRSGADGCQ